MLKFTSKVDRNGRPFAIRTTEKNVTKFSGLPFLMDRVRQAGVLSDVARILDSYVPRGLRCLYSTTDLIEQIMAGIFVKAPDLNDMKWLSNDHAFRIALSNPCCASPATMCRFFRSFSKDCQSERNEYLTENGLDLSSLAKTDPHRISTEVFLKLRDFTIGRAIDTVTKYYPEGPILVDVDSTPIEVFGSNGEIAYDGCYDCKGYLPILCLINGVPAFVQNAPGAANGAKLFSFHVQELLQRLKEAFPKRLIVIRADTGFSAPAIIDAVEKEDCKYLIGCNQAQKQMCAALYEHMVDRLVIAPDTPLTVPKAIAEALRLDNLFIKFKEPQPRDQFNTSCVDGKFRCTGFVPNYKAKSWATHRTIVYRFEYDPKRKEIDVRFIQTNLTKEEAIDMGTAINSKF